MNQDRTHSASTLPPIPAAYAGVIGPRPPGFATATIPMPGRLPVSYYNWDLRQGFEPSLDEVATGTLITATGTITTVRRLAGGRAMVVLTSEDHNSAHVLLNAALVRMVEPALSWGNRMHVRGSVTRTSALQPAGIDARSVNVEVF